MTARFVDTNVLIYAFSADPAERAKVNVARELMRQRDLALSAQVLQEFYVQATRPTRAHRLTHAEARDVLIARRRYPIAAITTAIVAAAIATRDRFQISYWDAAILEAARSLGCEIVLSEDLSDGMDYAGVRVENPFRDC